MKPKTIANSKDDSDKYCAIVSRNKNNIACSLQVSIYEVIANVLVDLQHFPFHTLFTWYDNTNITRPDTVKVKK